MIVHDFQSIPTIGEGFDLQFFFMQTDKVMFIFLEHCESDLCWSFYLLFLS